jgi:hypothetical protein
MVLDKGIMVFAQEIPPAETGDMDENPCYLESMRGN